MSGRSREAEYRENGGDEVTTERSSWNEFAKSALRPRLHPPAIPRVLSLDLARPVEIGCAVVHFPETVVGVSTV